MPFYVFVYEVGQSYGGPEEGGWWYEYGTPINHELNRVFATRPVAMAYMQQCKGKLRQENQEQGRRHPSSVLSSGDWLDVWVDEDLPKPYPEETPHYE